MQVVSRRLLLNGLIAVVGLLLGLIVVELLLALWGLPVVASEGASGRDRMHYIYTNTGLGKCYPSDPRGYFPYNLGIDTDLRTMREIIADVSDLPDELSIAEKVEHIRVAAPSLQQCSAGAAQPGTVSPSPAADSLDWRLFHVRRGLAARRHDRVAIERVGSGYEFQQHGMAGYVD